MRKKAPFFIRHIHVLLTIILLVKIGGYFSIVEERSINQIFKTISRTGMTLWLFYLYRKLLKLGCTNTSYLDNLLPFFLYLAYLLLGFASFSYSSDVNYSVLQWVMTFESFIFVILYVRTVTIYNHHFPNRPIHYERLFAWAIVPIMLTFIIGSFVDEDTFYRGMRGGEEKRLGGWIMNPNELGMLASIGSAMGYLLITLHGKKLAGIFIIALNIVILGLTSSRSSAIGFLLVIGLLGLLSGNRKVKIAMLIGIVIAVPVALNFIIFKDSGGVEEVMSMTGRLPFWKALLNEGIVKEPFFGYGFMRINYTDYFQGLYTYPGKMTHNTFMQVLMNLGFVGFFFVFWQLSSTITSFIRDKEVKNRAFFIAMFIPIIINSFTEFGIFGEANYGILFYQFLILLVCAKNKKKLTSRETIKREIFLSKKATWMLSHSGKQSL
jgi:hypothetical protein